MREINVNEVLNRMAYGDNAIQAIAYVVEEVNKVIYYVNSLELEVEQLRRELLAYKSIN